MNDSLQGIYEQIWNEHANDLKKYCNVKLRGRPNDAEDMLQDAFELLWEKIKKDDVPPNPKAWLIVTIKNLSLTEYRHTAKNKENISFAPFDETVQLYYSSDDVAEEVEKEELHAELWKVLIEDLSDEERRIVKYETIDEIPQAQIAEILGKSQGSTKQQIFRLKRKLKKIKREKENF